MGTVARKVGAVVAGVATWGVLWNLGNLGAQRALPEVVAPGRALDHVPVLLGFVALSVVLSLLAGWITATLAGPRPMVTVRVLAAIQLAIGIAVEVAYWALTPVWYHLLFLALVVPATLAGGRLSARSEGSGRPVPTPA